LFFFLGVALFFVFPPWALACSFLFSLFKLFFIPSFFPLDRFSVPWVHTPQFLRSFPHPPSSFGFFWAPHFCTHNQSVFFPSPPLELGTFDFLVETLLPCCSLGNANHLHDKASVGPPPSQKLPPLPRTNPLGTSEFFSILPG